MSKLSRRVTLSLAVALVGAALADRTLAGEPSRWIEARKRMVQEVMEMGVRDPRVCAALRATPRHLFVPPERQKLAYFDTPLPIGYGQTITSPFVVAYMTEQLDPQPTDRVLEIGTGSGYQAAVLSHIVEAVYTIEIVEPLGRQAMKRLRRLGYKNVFVKIGDGFAGWPEHAPFDKIIVTCSPEGIPKPLIEQLKDGGRMVIPVGERFQQTLCLVRKKGDRLIKEVLEPTYFVPMTGLAEKLRRIKEDSGFPELVNGGFEETLKGDKPQGWYYVRQASVVESGTAPGGQRYLHMKNEQVGRPAHAFQAVSLDGRKVREIRVSAWVALRGVRLGSSVRTLPQIEVAFFDAKRGPIGSQTLPAGVGTKTWTQRRTRMRVPPNARFGLVAVGMFGSVGEFLVDQVEIRAAGAGRR
ncbi:MAG: protein-L-isoaspartate(D-aspartate) O-methyltransferase [Planctomycetes bacterium]|nr:protein-L-isoaspartate(D-aspartate) O-methyltransferase [Planctomycetota bacterium]